MAKKDFFSSRNPVLKEKVFQQQGSGMSASVDYTPMTIAGAINKTMILFAILVAVSVISYSMASTFLLWTGMICGLIAVVVAVYKPHTSPIAAPVYAAFEGLFIGSITAFYGQMYDGIVFQAVMLTFASFAIMLFIYKFEIIKVTDKLKTGIIMATGSIFVLYLASWIFSMFGINLPFIHQGGWLSIGFSVVVIGVAAMNLLLDFDLFDKGAEEQSPQYMEWFCGLSLMITLVWLYVEFLRLLSYIND
jgi:uncharacterized YccA/Bax inhibitor family protein